MLGIKNGRRPQFDNAFVTDAERMKVVLENPVILIHEKKISAMKDLLPVRLEFLILSLNPGLRHRCVAPGVWPTTTEVRCHASLKGHTPLTFAGGHMVARAELNKVSQVSHCRDLVQLPVAA